MVRSVRCSIATCLTQIFIEILQLVFLYKLVEGAAPSSFGTHVASLAGVKATVVERAQSVSDDFAAKFLVLQTMRLNRILPLFAQADFAFLHRVSCDKLVQPSLVLPRLQSIQTNLRNSRKATGMLLH